jgi:hypothetical protein
LRKQWGFFRLYELFWLHDCAFAGSIHLDVRQYALRSSRRRKAKLILPKRFFSFIMKEFVRIVWAA